MIVDVVIALGTAVDSKSNEVDLEASNKKIKVLALIKYLTQCF